MFRLIGEIIWCVLSGMGIVFEAFLKALPIYNELGNIKEEMIACAIGVPVVVVSIALAIPTIINVLKRIRG